MFFMLVRVQVQLSLYNFDLSQTSGQSLKGSITGESFSMFLYKLTHNPMNGVCRRDQLT